MLLIHAVYYVEYAEEEEEEKMTRDIGDNAYTLIFNQKARSLKGYLSQVWFWKMIFGYMNLTKLRLLAYRTRISRHPINLIHI